MTTFMTCGTGGSGGAGSAGAYPRSDRELAEAVRRAVADYNAIVDELNSRLLVANDIGAKAIAAAQAAGLRVDGVNYEIGRGGSFSAHYQPMQKIFPPRMRREIEV